MFLSILIPTYNRSKELDKNLAILANIISRNELQNKVEIIISDNNSADDTLSMVKNFISKYENIKFHLYAQPQNIGLEKNALSILSKSNSEFIMYLGDDDYIDEHYLIDSINILGKNNNLNSIIPSYQNIFVNGEKMDRGRDLDKNSKYYKGGFYNCLVNSWRGHQLSGLILRREELLTEYYKNDVKNIYLFIFFVAISCLKGDSYHYTKYPILVTRPNQSKKDWGYKDDGLVSEIFDNFKKLPNINTIQRFLLEIHFLDVQYWRYAMYLKIGIGNFIKAVFKIVTCKNTSIITKFLFPFSIPVIFIKHVVVLLAKGNLIKTLKTKIEVN